METSPRKSPPPPGLPGGPEGQLPRPQGPREQPVLRGKGGLGLGLLSEGQEGQESQNLLSRPFPGRTFWAFPVSPQHPPVVLRNVEHPASVQHAQTP